MFIILTYDIAAKRNTPVRKICRKYLVHAQKSVFEGYVNERQYQQIKNALKPLIDPEEDQIAIYHIGSGGAVTKELIGYQISTDNIL